jgi:AcrR family transcriptional regulator
MGYGLAMDAFLRARRPDQKESRRAHLLATARAMLEAGTPLQELGLNELARRAEMTKSNVYRYFESREHVLLGLLREEWTAWFETLTTSWRAPAGKTPPLRHLARHLARTLAARPLLCELASALPGVLERNLSEGAIGEFKQLWLGFLTAVAAFVSARVPELTPPLAARLMYDGAALVTGLWPHANPAPAVARAIAATPELGVFQRDFAADLARFLYAIAADLVASHQS